MRKRVITPTPETIHSRGEGWLDVERAVFVEITSEDAHHPLNLPSHLARRPVGGQRRRASKRYG